MCTGTILRFQPCEHASIHYSMKCGDSQCFELNHFPITYVNGYCTACIGLDDTSRSGSIKSEESADTDVSGGVRAIGEKLDTLINIAGVVNAEVRSARRRVFVGAEEGDKVVYISDSTGPQASNVRKPTLTTDMVSRRLEKKPSMDNLFSLLHELNGDFRIWFDRMNKALGHLADGELEVAGRHIALSIAECNAGMCLCLLDGHQVLLRMVSISGHEVVFWLSFLLLLVGFFVGFGFATWLGNY